jgi:hypothetical protein
MGLADAGVSATQTARPAMTSRWISRVRVTDRVRKIEVNYSGPATRMGGVRNADAVGTGRS